jgi:hypothetical protein
MLLGCWAVAFPAKHIASTGAIMSERNNVTSLLVDEGGRARSPHFEGSVRDTFNLLCRF